MVKLTPFDEVGKRFGPRRTVDNDALARARRSLVGLSMGEAFGRQFLGVSDSTDPLLVERRPPPGPWPVSAVTVRAHALLHAQTGPESTRTEDRYVALLAAHYRLNPLGGYGDLEVMLADVLTGIPWRQVRERMPARDTAPAATASCAAPLGALFSEAPMSAVVAARTGASAVSKDPEAEAGAAVVAMAAALVTKSERNPRVIFEAALDVAGKSAVREGIYQATQKSPSWYVPSIVRSLGSGEAPGADRTVPFALWCAVNGLGSYEKAMWLAVSGRVASDVVGAMVGGIVGADPESPPPSEWLVRWESLESLDRVTLSFGDLRRMWRR